ncbi:hypothetical protein [Methylopila sp. M107]|uniref:hypothetical protein n=1 Tax=Methylopila sp. M107 TaxID=1101190 RepID=UPI00039DF724|nr:hypothetical protein [Methylopila sp. M107]
MPKVKAVLIKPLDGDPEGSEREFDKVDFDRLEAMKAVRRLGDREDGPTVGEYVAAGYKASSYPPAGYIARSTPEEIAAAVEAEGKAERAAKELPPVPNKKAPPVQTKSAD